MREFFCFIFTLVTIAVVIFSLAGALTVVLRYYPVKNEMKLINEKYNVNYSFSDYFWNDDVIIKTLQISNKESSLNLNMEK